MFQWNILIGFFEERKYYFYLYEICCFIQEISYLFLNRLHKLFYIFEGWICGLLDFSGFWNAEERKFNN